MPGILIEEVSITIKKGTQKPTPVTKRYGATYEFESGTVTLKRLRHSSLTEQSLVGLGWQEVRVRRLYRLAC